MEPQKAVITGEGTERVLDKLYSVSANNIEEGGKEGAGRGGGHDR